MQPFTRHQFDRLLDFVSTMIDFPGYRALEVPEANKPLIEWFYNHPLFQRFYLKPSIQVTYAGTREPPVDG